MGTLKAARQTPASPNQSSMARQTGENDVQTHAVDYVAGDVSKSAPSAPEVTHGLTLRSAQLTLAVLLGLKRIENRHFSMRPGWYVLHTGTKMSSHESQRALLASVPNMPAEAELPHGAIVGAFEISHVLTLDECEETEPWAFGPVCNVIRSVVRLERPVPHTGALSVWTIDSEAIDDVRLQLSQAVVHKNDLTNLPPPPAVFEKLKVKALRSRSY